MEVGLVVLQRIECTIFWFLDNGWIVQGVLGRFLPHLASWTQRGRRGGGSNRAADGESFSQNMSTYSLPGHIFFNISTYSSPFLHILHHLYIFFTISTYSSTFHIFFTIYTYSLTSLPPHTIMFHRPRFSNPPSPSAIDWFFLQTT